jgi:dihydrolipoamide dehydrogenase
LLNVGCIPSSNVSFFSSLCRNKAFEDHGIELTGEVKVNLAKWLLASKAVVDQTSGGVKFDGQNNNYLKD